MTLNPLLNTRFYALKSFLMVVLVLGGVLIPFLVSAVEYPITILNFYDDPLNENRITIDWIYNPNYLVYDEFPCIGAEVGAEYFHFGKEYPKALFREALEDCKSEAGNLICSSIPTTYYDPYDTKLEENPTGLTYDEMSPYLPEMYLIEGYLIVYYEGGFLAGGWEFEEFNWGDPARNPPCSLGFCKYCETYDTCIEAGCSWYYSTWLQQYFCVEPFEPEPEECGSFFKCQYCTTQTTCELQLNCEWIDRGLGFKCYMKEPTIPPPQVSWEVPELEDCDELTGIERWLCKIKNFIAGIFMPTQTKIDELYNTLGAFQQKFPFNYILALQTFFNSVRVSLDTQKSIPIKILGQEADVSFAFWDKTTTIGGVSETFKNILFDFTTILVFLCWFVWLIHFVRRFF